MYHGRFKKSHYEAGYHWGDLLYRNGEIIWKKPSFVITEERRIFAEKCYPIYERHYPEILEEIRGLAEGQRGSYEEFCGFLFSMYCFPFHNHCTCFAFRDHTHLIFGRNSDFLTELEKLYMNCLYQLKDVYAFNGNTTAFIEMEDGINEYGLAIGLTFLYPALIKPGLNAGMLVRYLLEKCTTVEEAVKSLKKIPIASQQTLTLADSTGSMAVIECNCEHMEIIRPTEKDNFVVAANIFTSEEMAKYNNNVIDNWRAEERYFVASRALKEHRNNFSLELAKDILSGKYGFMCQYDRRTGADTVWSVIYEHNGCKNVEDRKEIQNQTEIQNRADMDNMKICRIYRAEGNPSRKKFKEDTRL